MPALCSLWLAQHTFDTPNHKMATLAQHAGIPLVDAHAPFGDVWATSALLPIMPGLSSATLPPTTWAHGTNLEPPLR